MEILDNYIKAVQDMSNYFGVDIEGYTVEVNDGFFTVIEEDNEVCWAETIEELGDDNGDYYNVFQEHPSELL
jgi:hypothetical protein